MVAEPPNHVKEILENGADGLKLEEVIEKGLNDPDQTIAYHGGQDCPSCHSK